MTDNRTNDDRENLIARLTASINPLDVTCGECGSKPGNRCYGNGEMRRTHSSRASKAEHELRAAAADALEAATRERDDAAVAALERVRNVLELLRNYAEETIVTTHGMLSASFVKAHVEIALAALDEAPEPEEKQ